MSKSKKVFWLSLLFICFFVIPTSAEDISRDRAEKFLNGLAGKNVWIHRIGCIQGAANYYDKALQLAKLGGGNNVVSKYISEYEDKGKMLEMLVKAFNHLEEANIEVIDFDNKIILLRKQNGDQFLCRSKTYSGLMEIFPKGYLIDEYPFDNNETEEEINDIKQGKMHIGFTKWQAMLCWGYPAERNKTTTARGTEEQWVYKGEVKDYYLYLANDVVTAWQN